MNIITPSRVVKEEVKGRTRLVWSRVSWKGFRVMEMEWNSRIAAGQGAPQATDNVTHLETRDAGDWGD
jgi:hypothetical protein